MIKEGNETVINCDTFKFKAKDGKMKNADFLDTEEYYDLLNRYQVVKQSNLKWYIVFMINFHQ